MVKPIQRPSCWLTRLATSVPGPKRLPSSRLMRWLGPSVSKGSTRSPGSRGRMRSPSCSLMVLISDTRLMASACTRAARLRLTRAAISCAVCSALGSNSIALRVCSQASMLPTNSNVSKKNVRQNRPMALAAAVWHKHITHAPDGLDVAWRSGVGLKQFAQA